jgi:hypothetical protein
MNDEPNPVIRTASRTPRPIGNVTVGIITAIAIAACSSDRYDDRAAASTSDSQAVATSAPSPTSTPATHLTTVTLAPTAVTGSYTGLDGVAVAYTVPDVWYKLDDGWAVIKSGSDPVFGVAFWDVTNIFVDPCQLVLFDPPVGPSVDELASAWTKVPALEVTSTSDVTVDGYVGREVEFTVPDYEASECEQHKFGLWQENGAVGNVPNYWAQGPNVHPQLWILDVEGTRLVIKASYFPDTSEQDRADLEEILDSIQIG